MKIALTGGTGFIGRRIIRQLKSAGHEVRAWYRTDAAREGIADDVEWVKGDLNDPASIAPLFEGCSAAVHSALWMPAGGWRAPITDAADFAQRNIVGSLGLFQAAFDRKLERFVFLSTCAVHDVILPDRALDEAHPLWPKSHYGAHKAAIEKFVHSFGLGLGMPIAALRPTGVYGPAHPIEDSKWFGLVRSVKRGEAVRCDRGGKEVHVDDVARSVLLLLSAPNVEWGTSYNCYDRYIADYEVAELAARLCGTDPRIDGKMTSPKNQIDTTKLRNLGMTFGGGTLLEETIEELLRAA